MITIKSAVALLASLAALSIALPQPDTIHNSATAIAEGDKGSAYGNHPRKTEAHHEHHNHTHEINGTSHEHEERAAAKVLGIYECMNRKFVAPCQWTPLKDGECYNRNYGVSGSMGPDKGLTCALYEQPNCNDKGWNRVVPFVYPGIAEYDNSKLLSDGGMVQYGPISVRCTYNSITVHPTGNNGYNWHNPNTLYEPGKGTQY
ncbi:hypothetical protein EDD37DRAFT_627811 [Exophiala viscosa]|uniref:Ig-like domain-containing protein n=1 Tax=Exophiala viscosa TaxID=2486360 RepID=A0AAN6ICW2_9EURO|nr:hypothetical protein EDD36DRAFT_497852 [Exophiala viscosa]KAI1624724.1 hypothetical protein EDD37DRAFT_627811 [Exophiala viscosa]